MLSDLIIYQTERAIDNDDKSLKFIDGPYITFLEIPISNFSNTL